MIDTSRHFQTLAEIRRVIDSLPYGKLNVLHWHISDDQSFPFESKTYPKLWGAAHSKQERYVARSKSSLATEHLHKNTDGVPPSVFSRGGTLLLPLVMLTVALF